MHSEEHYTEQQRLVGLARVAGAGIVWGTIPLVIRAADGAPAITVFFRVFCAGIVVLLIMLARGTTGELARLKPRKILQVAGQGVLLTVNWFLFMTALDLTNVATAELLGYTGPVFVAVLAPFVTREAFDRRIIAPLALALGGIAVILVPQGLAVASRSEQIGAAMAFASALTYAALLLRSKKILRDISSSALMVVEYATACLVLLPFVALAVSRGDVPSTPTAYGALVTLGVVHSAFAGFLFLGGLRRLRADHTAILMYLEPAAAVLFAALFLNEPLTATTIAGGALVVAGGVVVARMEKRADVPIEVAGIEDADSDAVPTGKAPADAELATPAPSHAAGHIPDVHRTDR